MTMTMTSAEAILLYVSNAKPAWQWSGRWWWPNNSEASAWAAGGRRECIALVFAPGKIAATQQCSGIDGQYRSKRH